MNGRYRRLDDRIIGRDYAVDVETGEVLRVGADDLGVAELKQACAELKQALGLVVWWILPRRRR